MKHRLLIFAIILMIAGCAAPEKKKEQVVFYPDPPELPRMQFLVSFAGAKDIEPEKSAFDVFVTGTKESKVKLDKPYGVALYEGKIYVCDTNNTVMVFDFKKKTFLPLEGTKNPQGKLLQPLNISIDKEGNKYVTDPIRGQVVVFDKNDLYVRALGLPGAWKPVDAVPFEGRLYVADNGNHIIHVFDLKTGEKIHTIGKRGEPKEQVFMPINLAFDKEGYLYVTDAAKFQVLKFDRDGHFIKSIGEMGTGLGHFTRPRGIALDRDGLLYVVDAGTSNLQIFNKDNRLLLYFSRMGSGPGDLVLPAKVVIDYDNLQYFEKYVSPDFEVKYLILVTSQFGDRLVNLFAFGRQKGVKYPSEPEILEQIKKEVEELIKPSGPSEKSEEQNKEK